jgi:cytochrome P450
MTKGAVRRLDKERVRQLYDLTGSVYETRGGAFEVDPYPRFAELRESGPVHEGVAGDLVGFHGEAVFEGLPFPDRRHFSAFDFAICDEVFRDEERFCSAPEGPDSPSASAETVIIYMDRDRHRRYRALVQPSFVPKQARWWIERWIEDTVDELIDAIIDKCRADLFIEFFAPIPLLTICGSFGVTVDEALDIREAVTSDGLGLEPFFRILTPVVAARRSDPEDDLISVLVQAEMVTDTGDRAMLTDEEVLGFAYFLLAAGSGTTWKQMGIALLAMLTHPRCLDAVRRDRGLLRPVIEESLRWMPTDPVFARFAVRDTSLAGVDIPAGSVVHMVLAAANRDPARWERPDEFDPFRPLQSHLGFGSGHHICLGMHVARAEMSTAIGALVDRLPDLRLDPDAPPPRIVGMYERGPTAVPVRWA